MLINPEIAYDGDSGLHYRPIAYHHSNQVAGLWAHTHTPAPHSGARLPLSSRLPLDSSTGTWLVGIDIHSELHYDIRVAWKVRYAAKVVRVAPGAEGAAALEQTFNFGIALRLDPHSDIQHELLLR